MQSIEAGQRLLPHFRPAQQEGFGRRPQPWRVTRHARTHRNRPKSQLVPGQQVTGKAGAQRQQQQKDAHDPVEFPRRFVGPRVKDPRHVQHHHQHHKVRPPAVQVAQQLAEGHLGLQNNNIRISPFDRGCVIEHQQQPGQRQLHKRHHRHHTQPKGIGRAHAVPFHFDRVQVKEYIARHHQRAIQRVVRPTVAKERFPHPGLSNCMN